ncbi:MAG TPA: LuxR C-terminal-related transcriptional regulator [Anaerolineales bacterium]
MSLPPVSTKFHIPSLRAENVARPRLQQVLLQAADRPGLFVLVSGPAGFGKTTLLSGLAAARQADLAWDSLDESDNDPVRFWSALISACQAVRPGVGNAALALLQSPGFQPDAAIPTLLINDFAVLSDPFVIMLDDYHVIHTASIHAAMGFMIEHLPDPLRLVCSTRVDPPWPLARLRAQNRLVEIRAADLRFTFQEAAEFLNSRMGLDLTGEQMTALEARTEGWIAGLQLAALSLKNRPDARGFIEAFTGSHVFIADYLVEEVLSHQPDELQTFLMQTSILERLGAGLCEAVTGIPGAQATLASLQRRNLFVVPLDEEGIWYRFHPLFADLLRARLRRQFPPQACHALHQRAADWYEAAGMESEAIPHSLAASDPGHTVRLVEKIAMPMIMKAHFKTVEGWLKALPPESLRASPRARMAFAWLYLMQRDFSRAQPHLDHLQEYFSTTRAADAGNSLYGQWLALQAMRMGAQGKAVESCALAEQALKVLPGDEIGIRSLTRMSLANTYQQLFDFERAAGAFQEIVRQGQASADLSSEMLGLSCLGLMLLQQGKLHAAYEAAAQAIRRLEQTGAYSPFSATLYGELATISYHWHRLEEGRSYFSRSVEVSLPGGFMDAEIYHHVFLSRLCQMEGDLPGAAREINLALDQMQTAAPSFKREEVIAQHVNVCLALGRTAEAQSALEPCGFDFAAGFHHPELSPGVGIPPMLGLLQVSALRILLARDARAHRKDDLKNGLELADLLIENGLRCGNLPVVLQALLLRSRIHTALGSHPASRADLLKSLELAAPEDDLSPFLEEGAPLISLLEALERGSLPVGFPTPFLHSLLEALRGRGLVPAAASTHKLSHVEEEGLIEPLTPREREVLQLLAAGDPNLVIAEKLVITVSAVKKHTGNIFRKLNVNSRTQAAARARMLGLLDS